jgi:hypothetical protein
MVAYLLGQYCAERLISRGALDMAGRNYLNVQKARTLPIPRNPAPMRPEGSAVKRVSVQPSRRNSLPN